MQIKLGSDWQNVAKKAWSFRFMAIAGLASAIELIVPIYLPGKLPKAIFASISLISIGLGMFSRLVAQKDLDK